jgi:hypothetical protein
MSHRQCAIAAVVVLFTIPLACARCGATAIGIELDVVNHSFEDRLVPMDGDPSTTVLGDDFINAHLQKVTGWKVAGPSPGRIGQLTIAPGSYFVNQIALPPDASQQALWAIEQQTYLYQTLSATLEPGMRYVLQVDTGDRADLQFPDGVQIRLGYGSTPGKKLLAAESVLNPLPPDGGWTTWQSVFVTEDDPLGVGQPLRIELVTGGHQALFDNVRLQAIPIPEPSALVLSVLALAGLVWHGRRRR